MESTAKVITVLEATLEAVTTASTTIKAATRLEQHLIHHHLILLALLATNLGLILITLLLMVLRFTALGHTTTSAHRPTALAEQDTALHHRSTTRIRRRLMDLRTVHQHHPTNSRVTAMDQAATTTRHMAAALTNSLSISMAASPTATRATTKLS